jgi:hypothetical protein
MSIIFLQTVEEQVTNENHFEFQNACVHVTDAGHALLRTL